jgi:hypothetical protein
MCGPLEAGVLHGQAVARMLLKLKAKGFVPDVVIAHPGWGEALYVKDVFPRTKLISFFEFFYHPEGADCGFDPEFPVSFDDRTRIRSQKRVAPDEFGGLRYRHLADAVAERACTRRHITAKSR